MSVPIIETCETREMQEPQNTRLLNLLFFFAQYFTFYTFLGSLVVFFAKPWLNPWVVSIIQGMAFIVMISVVYIYVVYGLEPIQRFYQRFFSELFKNKTCVILFDISLHILPVFFAGIPTKTFIGFYGILIAYGLFIAWFMNARLRSGGLSGMYLPEMSAHHYDRFAFIYLPSILLIFTATASR